MKKRITKRIIIPTLVMVTAFAVYGFSRDTGIVIKTDYHDLPASESTEVRKLLKTENITSLSSESIRILQNYFQVKVLTGKSQFGRHLSGNYFWYIYNALPKFVSPLEQHMGYYKGEKVPGRDARLLAYCIYRIDRSPENLRKLFVLSRPFLQKIISGNDALTGRIHRPVSSLLSSYRRLEGINDIRKRLEDFYNKTYYSDGRVRRANPEVDALFDKGAYGFTVYELSKMIGRELGEGRYNTLSGSTDLTFWMRRNHEGNIDAVYSILCEIDSMIKTSRKK